MIPTFIASILNGLIWTKAQNLEANGEKEKAMKIFDHLDFTHGYHPTFTSMCVAPWNLNSIITTQGSSERIENLVQFFTLVPSWWFGDRMMNGLLAKRFDKKLAKKYQENPGIPA